MENINNKEQDNFVLRENSENSENIYSYVQEKITNLLLQDKKIKDVQQAISLVVKNNPEEIMTIMQSAVGTLISHNKQIQYIKKIISKTIKDNPEGVSDILDSSIQTLILEKKNSYCIQEVISDAIKTNPEKTLEITGISTNVLLSSGKNSKYIQNIVLKVIQENESKIHEIMNATTQVFLLQEKSKSDVDKDVQEIVINAIKENPEKTISIMETVVEILASKDNEDIKALVLKVIQNNTKVEVFDIFICLINCLISKDKSKDYIQDLLLSISQERNILIPDVVKATVLWLLQTKCDTEKIQNFILLLAKQNPNQLYVILNNSVKNLIKYKDEGKDKDTAHERINKIVLNLIKVYPDKISDIVDIAVTNFFKFKENNTDIVKEDINKFLSILIKDYPDKVDEIINGIFEGFFIREQNTIEIIFDLIKTNPDIISDILEDMLINLLDKKIPNDTIKTIILAATALNTDKVFDITQSVIQFFITKNGHLKEDKQICEIKTIILELVKQNPDKKAGIIINVIEALLVQEKNSIYIEKILTEFLSNNDILSVLTFYMISEYFYLKNTNKNLNNLIVYEAYAIKLYNQLNHNETIKEFSDIKIKKLIELKNKYFNTKFDSLGTSGGFSSISFFVANLLLLDKENIENCIDEKNFIKINLINKSFFDELLERSNKTVTKQEFIDHLINSGFLKKEDLKSETKFKIFFTLYVKHAFLIAIDNSKTYEELIKENSDGIFLIDSSIAIKRFTNRIIPENLRQLFSQMETLNGFYQKNGTCWANTIAAINVIFKDKDIKTIEDIKEKFKRKEKDKPSPLEEKIILFLATNFLSNGKKLENEYTNISDSLAIPYTKVSMFNKKYLLSKTLEQELKANEKTIKTISNQEFKEKEQKNNGLFVFENAEKQKFALRYSKKDRNTKIYNIK